MDTRQVEIQGASHQKDSLSRSLCFR
jgi:hypothetical protein